jgi:O-glycosyl hydrolase
MFAAGFVIWRKLFLGIGVMLTLTACQGMQESATPTPIPPIPTPTMTPAPYKTIQIFPDQPLQTIQDVGGGNFIHQTGESLVALDAIGKMNFDAFQPRYGRVRIVLEEWEPKNDNDDPGTFNWEAFKDTRYNHATFQLLQEFMQHGMNITASAWNAPNWMVSNPEADSQRVIDPAQYPELVESLAAWLVKARDEYGVTVDYLSFNESNGGYQLLVPATAYTEIIQLAAARFAALGLTTKWYLGDTYNIQSTMSYVVPLWAAKENRPYFGPLAFHSWDLDAPDKALQDIGKFAAREGLDVWCTEAGWDAELWREPERLASWEHAIKMAQVYNRALKMTRVSVFMYWQMVGYDYQINDGTKPYPAFEVLKQLADQLPPGSQILATSPNLNKLYFFAAQAPDHFMVHFVNRDDQPITVRVEEIPDGQYTLWVSTETAMNHPGGTLRSEGHTILVEIPAQSVVYLTSQK